ncbi:MAG TPA: hypothetical protein DEA05_15075 [Rhodobacteraceae bacterium]|nr:hypothetical protein [Paracoccaceae bacterium]
MLDLLAKVIGPHRAVSVYAFLRTWGLPLGLVLAALLGIGAMVLRGADQPEHVAYIRAEVLGTDPINGDRRNGLMVDLRLPDGEILRLTETEGLIAAKLEATACVQERRRPDGAALYRLRQPHRCGL